MMSRNDHSPVSRAQRSGRARSPQKAALRRWPLSWHLDWPEGGPSLRLSEWTGLETKGPGCGRGQCGRATGSGLGLGRLRGECCCPELVWRVRGPVTALRRAQAPSLWMDKVQREAGEGDREDEQRTQQAAVFSRAERGRCGLGCGGDRGCGVGHGVGWRGKGGNLGKVCVGEARQ